MIKFSITCVRPLIIFLILVLFIIVSYKVNSKEIISDIIDNEIIFSHDYMSGGDDDTAFTVAIIVFLPTTIMYLFFALKKKMFTFAVLYESFWHLIALNPKEKYNE